MCVLACMHTCRRACVYVCNIIIGENLHAQSSFVKTLHGLFVRFREKNTRLSHCGCCLPFVTPLSICYKLYYKFIRKFRLKINFDNKEINILIHLIASVCECVCGLNEKKTL